MRRDDRKDTSPACCCVMCRTSRSSVLAPTPYPTSILASVNIENRFRYNQAFKSVFSMVPSVIVMMLVLIPAIMATIAVVREEETGSIANFRSTPISKFEFLTGKQFPYVVVGMLTFILMLLMALLRFPRAGQGIVREPSRSGRCSTFSPLAVSGNSSLPSPRPRSQQFLQPRLSPLFPR